MFIKGRAGRRTHEVSQRREQDRRYRVVFVGETNERESFATPWRDKKKLCYSFGIRPMTGKFPLFPYKYHPV